MLRRDSHSSTWDHMDIVLWEYAFPYVRQWILYYENMYYHMSDIEYCIMSVCTTSEYSIYEGSKYLLWDYSNVPGRILYSSSRGGGIDRVVGSSLGGGLSRCGSRSSGGGHSRVVGRSRGGSRSRGCSSDRVVGRSRGGGRSRDGGRSRGVGRRKIKVLWTYITINYVSTTGDYALQYSISLAVDVLPQKMAWQGISRTKY